MQDQTVVLNTLSDDATASEVIIHSIMNAVAWKAQNAKDDSEDIQSFPSLIRKKNCFVQHREDDFPVCTSGQLIELVKDSPDIIHESYYHGGDHQKVYLLRVKLSDSYVARVSNVMLQDVPDEYFDRAYGKNRRDGVVVRNFKSRHGKGSIKKMLCIDLEPVWSDRGIDEKPQEAYEKYHCITVKINKEDMRFLGWIPGIDTQTTACSSLGEMFVSLGDRDPSMDPERAEEKYHQQPPRRLTFGQLRK
jgi:hypothetical protein